MAEQPEITPARRELDPRFHLLKVLGSIGVVMVHASIERVGTVDTGQIGWWLADIGNAAGRFGSAVFVMVGGAVLLARASEDRPVAFVKDRLARLLPIVLFWTAFYLIWRQWTWGNLTTAGVAKDLLLGMPFYHLWFVYMLLGLYLMIPALRLLVRDPRHRTLQYYALAVCAALTCLEAAAQTLQQTMHASFLGLSPLFIVYFIGGYLMHRDRPQAPVAALWLVPVACIAAMAVLVALLHPKLGAWAFVLIYSNRAPFAMLLTFCLFLGVFRLPREHALVRWAAPLGGVTLGIYAIHPFWIDMLKATGWQAMAFDSAWMVPAMAVYILSAATALALSRVPGLRRVVQ